jgi:hypothetical protein
VSLRYAFTPFLQHKKPPRAPLARELAVLFWRTLTEIIRNPTLLAMHCAMALVMGLLCGGIFYHIGNDIAGAQNRLGAPTSALSAAPCAYWILHPVFACLAPQSIGSLLPVPCKFAMRKSSVTNAIWPALHLGQQGHKQSKAIA